MTSNQPGTDHPINLVKVSISNTQAQQPSLEQHYVGNQTKDGNRRACHPPL